MKKISKSNMDSDLILESDTKSYLWSIRPCHVYKDEYRECKSIKGRFQQYFVSGDTLDCGSWEHDFENCVKFEEEKDEEAAKKIIESEKERRKDRMKGHFGNNVWKKRGQPPEDWNKPLPDHISKSYENSYLDVKNKEMKGMPMSDEAVSSSIQSNTFCTIM